METTDGDLCAVKGSGATGAVKCTRCGKKGHETSKCSVDLSRTKCYKCDSFGHISLNCSKKKGKSDDDASAKSSKGKWNPKDPKGSSSEVSKGKGTGTKKGGKKGKLFCVWDEESEQWWYTETGPGEEAGEGDQEGETETAGNVMLLTGLLNVGETGTSVCKNEPNTQAHQQHRVVPELFDISHMGDDEGMSEPSKWDGIKFVDGSVEEFSRSTEEVYTCPWVCLGLEEKRSFSAFGFKTDCLGDVVSPEAPLETPSSLQSSEFWLQSPLLSSLQGDLNLDFWLIDSGASMSVVNRDCLEQFAHTPVVAIEKVFQAADGTKVHFDGICTIALGAKVKDENGKQRDAAFQVHVVVGDTPYNILSTCQLGKKGWRFTLSDGVQVSHDKWNVELTDVLLWCDTPWVKVFPYHGSNLVWENQAVSSGRQLGALKRMPITPEELQIHRIKGHNPFHPACPDCIKAKGVYRHRRRTNKGLETEVRADFMYLSCTGEFLDESRLESVQGKRFHKILVLRESYSSSIGAVLMTANTDRNFSKVVHWLQEFGLESKDTSIVLITDSEKVVSAFVTKSSTQYNFLVRRAGPQNHESSGSVERTVRVLREGLATLQSDYERMCCSLQWDENTVQRALNYVCFSHNMYSKAHESDQSPRELAVGRRLPVGQHALFGTKVMAETPDSIKSLNPNLSRFVDACFLHPQFNSMGSLVFARIRVEDELIPKVFVAKSLKLVLPPEVDHTSNMFVKLKGGEELVAEQDRLSSPSRVLPSAQDVSFQSPPSGPPQEFLDRFGFQRGCKACDSLEIFGTKEGFTHNAQCRERYARWLKDQVVGVDAGGLKSRQEASLGDDVDAGADHVDDGEAVREGDEDDYLPSSGDASPNAGLGLEGENSAAVQTTFAKADAFETGEHPEPLLKRAKQVFTRGCPSCESGMNAPGIRHTKACRKRQLDLISASDDAENCAPESDLGSAGLRGKRAAEVPTESLEHKLDLSELDVGDEFARLDASASSSAKGIKRTSDTPIESLEEEILKEKESKGSLSNSLLGFVEVSSLITPYVPLLEGLIESVQFDHRATSVVVPFGDGQVRIWHPSSAVDDSTLQTLSGEQTFEGMKKEIGDLWDMRTGDLYDSEGVKNLKARNPKIQFRIIGTRWVTVQKTPATVRARLVVKDVANKHSATARTLGISSPTPSSEALNVLLSLAGTLDWAIGSSDVAHAFMATPLRVRDIIIRFPLSITSADGSPLFLHLSKALNGLRKASQEWVCYLSQIVGGNLNLKNCSLEPCVYTGRTSKNVPVALIVYVDDLLAIAPTTKDIDEVFEVIGQKVVLKRTGTIKPSKDGGGRLDFLGRVIFRQKGDKSILVSLPSNYLDASVKEYGLNGKGSLHPPDIALHLEKENGTALSPEAFSRFRSALGKVAWLSQTRQDLRIYVSLLASTCK